MIMARNMDTYIMAFVVEETAHDANPADGVIVSVHYITAGIDAYIDVTLNPTDNAATKNSAIISAVVADANTRPGRSFQAARVSLSGGFA